MLIVFIEKFSRNRSENKLLTTIYQNIQLTYYPAIPSSECSPIDKSLTVFIRRDFTMKICNQETRKNSRQQEKLGY